MSDIVARLDRCWNSIDPKARVAALEAAMAIRTLRSDLFIAHEQCRALRAEVDARVKEARRDALEEAARLAKHYATIVPMHGSLKSDIFEAAAQAATEIAASIDARAEKGEGDE